MKHFFTSMLGALAALVVFAAGGVILLIGVITTFALLGGGEAKPSLEHGSYLVLDLGLRITEAPPPVDFRSLGAKADTLQLRTVTRALRSAAKDDRIAGVFITGDLSPGSFGTGLAALREVRDAIHTVRSAGKPVMGYFTHATTRNYYLASAASDLAIDPYGMILMPGLASEQLFLAGAFEKYGVNVQVTRVGKYKSAVEPFTRRDMSPENREELGKLLGDLWSGILNDIAPDRGLVPDKIQAVVDSEGLLRAEMAVEAGLVDRIAYRDEIYDELKRRTGRAGSKEPFKQVTIENYAKIAKDIPELPAHAGDSGETPHRKSSGRGRVAIVYAEGNIVDGEGEMTDVGGSRFSRALRQLRQDPEVKAVVLRVNSPGGSASASEVIQREVRLLKTVKPVVVSMGSYAASGGYWISAYGDRIFAEPATITGSIGVFGMQFDVQRLANNLGITFDTVKTGRFADALTLARPKTPEEMEILQRMVDWIYAEFVAKVAEGRGLDREAVEAIAQGRVWSGSDALKIGLVDELGGLDAAVAHAVEKAGLGPGYRLDEYPRPKALYEAIQEMIGKGIPDFVGSRGLAGTIADRIDEELTMLRSFNDPRGIYARLPMNLSIR